MLSSILYKTDGNVLPVVRKIMQTKIQMLEKAKQNRLMLLSNCTVCGKKKSRFIKNQELQ